MSEEKKDVIHGRKFYYLLVNPHLDKDGVEGTREKAKQMQNALRNLGVTVWLRSGDVLED